MKNSGVPWLGIVPEHWAVRRLKYLLREQDTRSLGGREQLLRVSQYTGITKRNSFDDNDEEQTRAESLVGYKCVEPNDLVVNIMLAWNGSMGVSRYEGIASPAYCVYRFYQGAQPWYFHYLLRSPIYKARIRAMSTGVVESRLRLYTDDLYRIEAILPPILEQLSIVRFINYVDQRIQRYIRTKHKLIKLLEEQKQAIIHRAVTRGLNYKVRLRPSGVEWLGDVPKHWDVLPIKQAFISMEYGISESASDQGKIRLLTMGHIRNGTVVVPNEGGVNSVEPSLLLRKNDLLFNRTNSAELVGKVGLLRDDSVQVTFASYLVRLRPKECNDPEFLNLLLNDSSVRSLARREAIPSLHQSNLNPTRYGRLHIALPPKAEQKDIAHLVAESTSELFKAIERSEQEIALLREFRTRLIADLVTGKVDVREAAKRLPEEAEEQESIEQTEGEAVEVQDEVDEIPEEAEA